MSDIKELKTVLEQRILEAGNVVIVPHIGVDFDAIGSAIGIAHIAKKLNKDAYIIVNDPIYRIDYGVQIIIDAAKKEFQIVSLDTYLHNKSENDIYILTDVNKSKLIYLGKELNQNNTIIIDHHDEDATTLPAIIKYIDQNASSASEITSKLLGLYKVKETPDIANYLLAGIYLDTNKLTKNASSDTMKIVAKLLKFGANMNKVTDWFAEDFMSDRRVQELVSKASMATFSVAIVCGEEGVEYTKEELAKVADYLLKFRVDAAFAIGNIGDNIISISARSKEKVDVGIIMQELEGGGNKYSAATKLTNITIKDAYDKLFKIIKPPFYMQ